MLRWAPRCQHGLCTSARRRRQELTPKLSGSQFPLPRKTKPSGIGSLVIVSAHCLSLALRITHGAGSRIRGSPRTWSLKAGLEHDPENPEGHLLEACQHPPEWGSPTSLLRPLGGIQRGTVGGNLINCGMKYLSTYTSLSNLSLLEISIMFSFLMSLL